LKLDELELCIDVLLHGSLGAHLVVALIKSFPIVVASVYQWLVSWCGLPLVMFVTWYFIWKVSSQKWYICSCIHHKLFCWFYLYCCCRLCWYDYFLCYLLVSGGIVFVHNIGFVMAIILFSLVGFFFFFFFVFVLL